MEWPEVLNKLERAKAAFLEADSYLLDVGANERSMTHKFAEYLQREFTGWTVDCEYNRDGDIPKRLRLRMHERVSIADEDAQTVFPDIVVHHRGRQAEGELRNLLVIEAKKSTNRESIASTDSEKLEAFQGTEYRYRYAAFLLFVRDGGTVDIVITPRGQGIQLPQPG